MARGFTGNAPIQKEFIKVFNSLTGKYNPWEVWQDMVWCIAIAISNKVDNRYRDQREERYMQIIQRYEPDEARKFPELYAILVRNVIEKTERGNWGDFLGELFMNLELGNNLRGQFFTPYSVCKMMAETVIDRNAEEMREKLATDGYFSIVDPSCGAGATLIAAAEVLSERGIEYPWRAIFAGQDIDSTTALMCYIQLSMLGCAGYVVIGDSLMEPMTGHALLGEDSSRCWVTPMFCEEHWHRRREAHVAIARFRHVMNILENKTDTTPTSEPETNPVKIKSKAQKCQEIQKEELNKSNLQIAFDI